MACTCQASPFICVSFTLFYIYSGWVIVAVMTGTVSFTMISFKERMVQDADSREEELSENFFTCLDRVAIHENMQHFLETLRKHFRVLFISRRRGILWSSCLRISLKNWIPMEMETHLITISLPKIIDQQSSTVTWVCRGELDYEEFKALLKSKEVLLLLSEHTDINIQDLEDTFQRGSYCRVCKIE